MSKPNIEEQKKEATSIAKKLIQLSALRLNITKEEEALKGELHSVMSEAKLESVTATVILDGKKTDVAVTRAETATSSINIEKLASLLTPDQFMSCASVTLTKAKDVLPQALIDTCVVVGEPRISFKVTASKGFSVPSYTLFK